MANEADRKALQGIARNVVLAKEYTAPILVALDVVDAAIAAGWRPPAQVITSIDELDRLQPSAAIAAAREHGYAITPAVIEDACGDVYERDIDNAISEASGTLPHAGWWTTGAAREDVDSANLLFPVTVLRPPSPTEKAEPE